MQAGVGLLDTDVMPIFMTIALHWYASVLYKWFLTPFRDDIWNRRLVSVAIGGSFPHDPETVADMPS